MFAKICIDCGNHFNIWVFVLQLFSSHLPQNGTDEEGILGFLLSDIKKEVKKNNKTVLLLNAILLQLFKISYYTIHLCFLTDYRYAVTVTYLVPLLFAVLKNVKLNFICLVVLKITHFIHSMVNSST